MHESGHIIYIRSIRNTPGSNRSWGGRKTCLCWHSCRLSANLSGWISKNHQRSHQSVSRGTLVYDILVQRTQISTEFLAGITLHKSATKSGGDYVCGITFVTNRRKHNFGAVIRDIHRIPMDVTSSDMRIVAICGMHSGLICEHIGIYAKAFGWKTRGPHILLRKLVEEGRAEANATDDTSSPPDTPIRWLMDADPGLFRSVLKYV